MIEQHVSPADCFRPGFIAPALLGNVRLDFEPKDEEVPFSAPEGELRHCVFVSTDRHDVTAARGVSSSVHGVSGMAGVGKTTALIGLGHDPEVKAHFVHGVLYMSLGAAATEEIVSNELSKILELTGAVSRAAEVGTASSISEAVSRTATWFYGKRSLFLIDDIWPTPGHPQGYLSEQGGL